MGGPDLVRALRVKRPLLPVVIVSGYTNRELITYGANELDVPFLAKPFRADDLLRTVRKAIAPAA
jgi:two-component system cell cycle sensor histidine kinase/response regulator CckA